MAKFSFSTTNSRRTFAAIAATPAGAEVNAHDNPKLVVVSLHL